MSSLLVLSLLSLLGTSGLANAAPARNPRGRRSTSSAVQAVYAHNILENNGIYDQADWKSDMQTAQSIGIDGFALNIGNTSNTDPQLANAYAAAEAIGFTCFISFDFASFPDFATDPSSYLIPRLSTYASSSAAAKVNGNVLVSSFVGDTDGSVFDWSQVRSAIPGVTLEVIPNYLASDATQGDIDGELSWVAWPEDDNGDPIDANMTTASDTDYQNALGSELYMAPVSPWFYTHLPAGPGYAAKNWLFLSDTLLTTRLEEMFTVKPDLIEILTWNDFGESHYIGDLPSETSVYPDGSIPYTLGTNMVHAGWRDILALYITAYKAGATSVSVVNEELVYWHRPTPAAVTCSSDSIGPPNGSTYPQDAVFVATLLNSTADSLTITGGQGTVTTVDSIPAGVNVYSAPMEAGNFTFALNRGGSAVLSGESGLAISESCLDNTYNYNAYVGTITGSS